MKKLIILIVFILSAIAAILTVYFINRATSSSSQLELTVQTNGGVPYNWECEIGDTSIVKLVEQKSVDSNPELAGGVVYLHYYFEGLKEGNTTITFKYKDIRNGNIEREETNIVKVDNNKNISLVGIAN